ncbi:P43 5S RNA-binding protein-like [Brachionichthys hirsutus]|uniref:P43 5S RNA-binding protein-like n=1 Tax=Brachionichthys hirsutus TaxID=412623 RepID=UPI0036047CA1
MNGICGPTPPKRLLHCAYANCGATFTRQRRLNEHETVHAGERPWLCAVSGCGRRFSRRLHLSRHALRHAGVKKLACKFAGCAQSFADGGKLKRHACYFHGDQNYFKCDHPGCSLTFKKRRMFKLHLQEHDSSPRFRCSKDGCDAAFHSHGARKAHEKKHAGYRCPHANCQVLEHTWSKLQKHVAKHPATFTCQTCEKVFKRRDALRRHKRVHASHKPVLACPRGDCRAYFSTTFNLQHHIRKVHLELLKHKCSFPDCPRVFAMRESMTRHLLCHDPPAAKLKKRQRPKKSWQKRLDQKQLPRVEEDLRRLFALRMRIARRAKVEVDLSPLFNERKIRHYVDPEVNLRSLFGIKGPPPLEV